MEVAKKVVVNVLEVLKELDQISLHRLKKEKEPFQELTEETLAPHRSKTELLGLSWLRKSRLLKKS